jgi:hypothetical protein
MTILTTPLKVYFSKKHNGIVSDVVQFLLEQYGLPTEGAIYVGISEIDKRKLEKSIFAPILIQQSVILWNSCPPLLELLPELKTAKLVLAFLIPKPFKWEEE